MADLFDSYKFRIILVNGITGANIYGETTVDESFKKKILNFPRSTIFFISNNGKKIIN